MKEGKFFIKNIGKEKEKSRENPKKRTHESEHAGYFLPVGAGKGGSGEGEWVSLKAWILDHGGKKGWGRRKKR